MADRPVEPPRTVEGDVLTEIVLRIFRLNGQLLAAAERMAGPVGLTAAWWQVLGAVLRGPLTVAGIARDMGLARQSVQRIADLLVNRGLAEYRPNPAHRRAKLLAPSTAGWAAIRALAPAQHTFANRVTEGLSAGELRQTLDVLDRLIEVTAPRPDGVASNAASRRDRIGPATSAKEEAGWSSGPSELSG
jgi:DNA-binding MarR family transcriptional regulator